MKCKKEHVNTVVNGIAPGCLAVGDRYKTIDMFRSRYLVSITKTMYMEHVNVS